MNLCLCVSGSVHTGACLCATVCGGVQSAIRTCRQRNPAEIVTASRSFAESRSRQPGCTMPGRVSSRRAAVRARVQAQQRTSRLSQSNAQFGKDRVDFDDICHQEERHLPQRSDTRLSHRTMCGAINQRYLGRPVRSARYSGQLAGSRGSSAVVSRNATAAAIYRSLVPPAAAAGSAAAECEPRRAQSSARGTACSTSCIALHCIRIVTECSPVRAILSQTAPDCP